MPNWCDNSAYFRNDDVTKIDALQKVLEDKENQQVFQHLRPNPSGEWEYDWSITNWGTKWEMGIIDWERQEDNCIWIAFESAWSPPTSLYEYLDGQGWDVEAYYHEPGMGYAGQFIEGHDDCYEYSLSDKDSIDSLPSDVIDFAGLENAHEDYIDNITTDVLWGLPRTEMIDGKIKPEKIGRYIIKTKDRDYDQFATWDGKSWGEYWDGKKIKPTQWCGLMQELTEEELDTLVKEQIE